MSMNPCELCMRLIGRPGHVPPHVHLARSAALSRTSQGSAHVYLCARCRQAIVLATDDDEGPDRWKAYST